MTAAITPVVRVLLPITALVWVAFEIRQALQQRPEAEVGDRGSRPAIRLAAVAGAAGAVLCRRTLVSATIGPQAVVEWVGLALLWCGAGLRIWSFLTLGRYFTFTVQTSQDQPVISAGPYRVIRHPGYAGLLVAVVGVGCFINNWASLIVLTGAVTAGTVYRITVEERALSRDLGGRYQSYAEGRKRLIPLIW